MCARERAAPVSEWVYVGMWIIHVGRRLLLVHRLDGLWTNFLVPSAMERAAENSAFYPPAACPGLRFSVGNVKCAYASKGFPRSWIILSGSRFNSKHMYTLNSKRGSLRPLIITIKLGFWNVTSTAEHILKLHWRLVTAYRFCYDLFVVRSRVY